ncbi:MAG: ABC transporter permease [Pseudomonadota bacterium]
MRGLIGLHLGFTLRTLVRSPGYWVPTLLFPCMLFLFFGVHLSTGDPDAAALIMASWCCYAVIGVAFYQFGVGIAQDRESEWENYVRVLPAPALARIAARAMVGAIFAVAAAALVGFAAIVLTPVDVDVDVVARLGIALLIGSLPFALLGIGLGYWVSAKSAVPIANLLYLPLSYAGGLWIPPDRLPSALYDVSLMLPTRRLGEVAWASVRGIPASAEHWLWLLGFTVIFGLIALWGYRRDEGERYA